MSKSPPSSGSSDLPVSPRPATTARTSDQETWAAGDFSRVATGQTIVGEQLCEAVGLRARERLLDVATGSGNTALAAARRRAIVTGVDFVPALLERARERAAVERLSVEFREGHAEDLGPPDGGYDCVLSTFGVMFSSEPKRAASELVRVCRRGGRIGLASWTPNGFVGELFAMVARHVPRLAGIARATRWGTGAGLADLFADLPVRPQLRTTHVVVRADSPEAYVGFFRQYFGPTVSAFAALDSPGQERLEAELLATVARFNQAADGTTFVPAEYLEAILVRS